MNTTEFVFHINRIFRSIVFFIFLISVFIFPADRCHAQDLRQIQPGPVPPQVEAPKAPDITPQKPALPGPADETVMVEALKGLVFVSASEQVVTDPPLPKDGIDASKVPLLQSDDTRKVLDPFIGQPVSMASLNRLISTLYLYYSEQDLPFVSITLPEQDITAGVVQILVIEGVVGEITIEGARYFSEDLYRSMLRLKAGEPLRKSMMEGDVDWINRNPFRAGNFYLKPGQSAVGTTDLVFRVRERVPLRAYAGFNNRGTSLTGKNRLEAGFNWGNALGLGHQFNYQFTTNTDLEDYIGHSGSYLVPLPWRHFLTLSGSASHTRSRLDDPLAQKGRSSQWSLRYEAPLSNAGRYTQSVSAIFDFKKSDNNLEFSGIPVTDNDTGILQWSLQYNGSLYDARGVTSFSVRGTCSPGDLSSRNRDEFFSISRAYAKARYAYAVFDLTRVHNLPKECSLYLLGRAQIADGNLLGSEQMQFGGSSSIRGYVEGDTYGDQGYILTQELRAPPLMPGRWFGFEGINDSLQVYLFHDYGFSQNVDLLPDERRFAILQSVGAGMRYFVGRYVSVTFDYGWRQRVTEKSGRGSRGHLALTISF